MLSVNEVRSGLTQEQNSKYRDYQIERWIAHKGGKKADVIKTIQNQHINENRVKTILSDPSLRRHNWYELNRGVLNLVHIPEQHKVVVYVLPLMNKPKHFCERDAMDGILLFMYYVLLQIELLEGQGKQADLVVDQTVGSMPSWAEIKSQLKVFSGIMGRTFPKLFSCMLMCCNWNQFLRQAITGLAVRAGIEGAFVTPTDLVERYGSQYVPICLGGSLDLEQRSPIGTVLERFYSTSLIDNGSDSYNGVESFRSYLASGNSNHDIEEPSHENHIESEVDHHEVHPKLLWQSIMTEPLDLEKRQNYKTEEQNTTNSTENILGISLHLSLALLVMCLTNNLLVLIVAIILIVMSYIYKHHPRYLSFLIPQSVDINTSQPNALLAVMKRILEEELIDCEMLLQPLSLYFDVKRSITDAMHSDHISLCFCLALSHKEKDSIKRSIQKVVKMAKELPYFEEYTIKIPDIYKRWNGLFNWLQKVTISPIRCSCGCSQVGDMDFLDIHLWEGTACYSRAASLLTQGAGSSRQHDNVNGAEIKLRRLNSRRSSNASPPPVPLPPLPSVPSDVVPSCWPGLALRNKTNKTPNPNRNTVNLGLRKDSMPVPSHKRTRSNSMPSMPTMMTREPVRHQTETTVVVVKEKDKSAKYCSTCAHKFTLTRRRHWCRKCKTAICAKCTIYPAKEKGKGMCSECFASDRDLRNEPASIGSSSPTHSSGEGELGDTVITLPPRRIRI